MCVHSESCVNSKRQSVQQMGHEPEGTLHMYEGIGSHHKGISHCYSAFPESVRDVVKNRCLLAGVISAGERELRKGCKQDTFPKPQDPFGRRAGFSSACKTSELLLSSALCTEVRKEPVSSQLPLASCDPTGEDDKKEPHLLGAACQWVQSLRNSMSGSVPWQSASDPACLNAGSDTYMAEWLQCATSKIDAASAAVALHIQFNLHRTNTFPQTLPDSF